METWWVACWISGPVITSGNIRSTSSTIFQRLDIGDFPIPVSQIANRSHPGKYTLSEETLYNASITLSKASVLFFYSRIFAVDRYLLLVLRLVGFLLFGFCMSAVFGLIFADHPFQAQWNVTEPHTSIKSKDFWISMAVINICLDVAILVIPQARVRKLQMSRQRKLLLQGVFLLGAL